MRLRTDRPFGSRARNVIAFVVIVWGVAATFVAFEALSLSVFDVVLSNPSLFGDVMVSRTVTESTSCAAPAGSDRPKATASDADARVSPWLLGINLGRDALFRQYAGSNRQVPEQLAMERKDLAAGLSVTAPPFFTPEQFANANTEFVAFIEEGGATETARQLAATYSPRACELFKLGAFWGYSEMVRPMLPGERAVHATEIRHHAMRADVPDPLWNSMVQPTAADAKREDIIAATESLTDGITAYLAEGSPAP